MHTVKELLCYCFKNCELCGKPYGKYKKQEYGYICDECLNDINNARIKHRMSFATPLVLNDKSRIDVYSIFRYEEEAKDALYAFKVNTKRSFAFLFSFFLKDSLKKWGINSCDSVFIPVPASVKGKRDRGYDQVMEVLISSSLEVWDVVEHANKTAVMQKKLSREDRVLAVKGKYRIATDQLKELLNDRLKRGQLKIIIIDDVFTTGSSIREVSSLVKECIGTLPNVEIIGVSLFRDEQPL